MKTPAIIIVPGGEEPRTYPRVFLSDGDHSKAFEITNWLASVNVNSSADVHSNQVSCHFAGEVIHLAALPVAPAAKDFSNSIFKGKSRPWLEGFQAHRKYRLNLKECEELDSPAVPVRPENPYIGDPRIQIAGKAWGAGWCECKEYLVDEIPDPTDELSKLHPIR